MVRNRRNVKRTVEKPQEGAKSAKVSTARSQRRGQQRPAGDLGVRRRRGGSFQAGSGRERPSPHGGSYLRHAASKGPRSLERGRNGFVHHDLGVNDASTGPHSPERGWTQRRDQSIHRLRASTGPRPLERGRQRQHGTAFNSLNASMGPGSPEHGRLARSECADSHGATSTGPRSLERGRVNRVRRGEERSGPDFNGAALT